MLILNIFFWFEWIVVIQLSLIIIFIWVLTELAVSRLQGQGIDLVGVVNNIVSSNIEIQSIMDRVDDRLDRIEATVVDGRDLKEEREIIFEDAERRRAQRDKGDSTQN